MPSKPVARISSLVLALLALPIAAALPAGSARAQVIATVPPSVIVSGVGTASAAAATATMQMIIGRGNREFGFSEDVSGGSSFEGARGGGFSSVQLEPVDSESETRAAGTPVAGPENHRHRRSKPGPITTEQLAPILAAISSTAGLNKDAIDVDFSPLATEPFGGRSESARLEFMVAEPNPEQLTELIRTASDAASGNGLVVEVAGVRYDPADCAALQEAAEVAAIADARARAERLARLLGVALGEVVAANNADYYGPPEEGCGGQEGSSYESGHGGLGLSMAIFDPTQPAEVSVTTRLTIGYAIVANGSD